LANSNKKTKIINFYPKSFNLKTFLLANPQFSIRFLKFLRWVCVCVYAFWCPWWSVYEIDWSWY